PGACSTQSSAGSSWAASETSSDRGKDSKHSESRSEPVEYRLRPVNASRYAPVGTNTLWSCQMSPSGQGRSPRVKRKEQRGAQQNTTRPPNVRVKAMA